MRAMKNVPRSRLVKETTRYDDLLGRSRLTQALLKDKKGKLKQKLFGDRLRIERGNHSAIKIHLRSSTAAHQFAQLIRQKVKASKRNILFEGRFNERTGRVRIVQKLRIDRCGFVDDRAAKAGKRRKNTNWNTPRFFNKTWIDMPPFENEAVTPFVSFRVSFLSIDDKIAFAELIKQRRALN